MSFETACKTFNADPAVQAYRREYESRPEVKAKRKAYRSRPDIKEKRAEYWQKWYSEHKAERAAKAKEYYKSKKKDSAI